MHTSSWYNPTSLAAIPWRPARTRRRSFVTAQDWFCGAGGSAQALMAAGVTVVVSGNHDPLAIDVHATNFPGVEHVRHDIRQVNVRAYPTTDIGVFTSECTFLVKANAKGTKGMNGQLLLWEDEEDERQLKIKAERSRSLMKEVLRFTEYHRYAIVFVENVTDIYRWANFEWWIGEMQKMGYTYVPIIFNSQFAPAYPIAVPQNRERYYGLFIDERQVSRMPDLDIRPPADCSRCGAVSAIQRWKKQARQYGEWNKSYVYACPICHAEVRPHFTPASSAIDWSLPTVAIGERAELKRRPLKETTMRRIQKGMERIGYGPLIVDTVFTYGGPDNTQARSVDDVIPTQTTRQSLMLATPFMVDLRGTAQHQVDSTARSLEEPVSTICASGGHHMLVEPPAAAFTVQYYRTGGATLLTEPIPTLTARDRHRLVLAEKPSRDIRDWRTRMLDPDRELKQMMGFPSDYILKGNKKQRTALIGRSLNPAVVTEILRRCVEVL